MKLLIVVDVGNTATSCGVFKVGRKLSRPSPLSVYTISTKSLRSPGALSLFLAKKLKLDRFKIVDFIGGTVASVVPALDTRIKKELGSFFNFPIAFVSSKSRSRIKVRTRIPSQVGADRLVNARAAMEWWKGPSVIVDFGTATTFDCVTSRGEYLGGVIAPGPVISAEALYQRTAKLPMVSLDRPARVLGRDTLESIQSGLYHGYRGLVKEIVAQLKKRLGPRTKIFATGGQAKWILKDLGVVDVHVPFLTLQGLYNYWMDSHFVQ